MSVNYACNIRFWTPEHLYRIKEIIYLPADGNYYEIDTTQEHTALNGSRKDRIHIVGCVT